MVIVQSTLAFFQDLLVYSWGGRAICVHGRQMKNGNSWVLSRDVTFRDTVENKKFSGEPNNFNSFMKDASWVIRPTIALFHGIAT